MRDLNSVSEKSSAQSKSSTGDLPGSMLGQVVADLQTTRPSPGLWRFFASVSATFISLALSYEFSTHESGFYFFGVLAGVFFAAAAVTTHDAIHHTLTGIEWFDEISARFVTWPALWPHGIYSELHKLHHKMNGVDLRDPERVTYTEDEYKTANFLVRFYIRHQLPFAVFVAGGLGMILGHLYRAVGFFSQSKGIRRQLVCDVVGILAVSGTLFGIAAQQGQFGKAALLYFIVERIGGGLLQFRAHIEHYGLSGKRSNYFATQLYACRNIKTTRTMSWLMNGLNFHSIHHAFPKVPFYHLEEATLRMNQLLSRNKAEALPHSDGYMRTFIGLSQELKLIKPNQTLQVENTAVHGM